MNLGNFAGGLASGYQAGERLNIAKSDAASLQKAREQQTAIAGEKHEWEQLDRESATKLNTDLKSLYTSTFGDDPAATMKNDPESYLRFHTGKIALGFKYGKTNPEELTAVATKIKAEADAKGYQDVFAAVGGNPEAKARVFPKIGLDPSKPVQYGYDPKSGRYLASQGGQQVDISLAMRSLGLLKAAEDFDGLAKNAQDADKTAADLKYKGAATTAQLASAGSSSASADQTRAETGNLKKGLPKDGGAAKQLDAVKATSDILVKSDSFKILSGDMQKTANRYAQYLATEGGMNPADAALTALSEAQKKLTKGK